MSGFVLFPFSFFLDDGPLCACAKYKGLEPSLALVVPSTRMFVCSPACACGPRCRNKIDEGPLALHFEIFRTEKKGWGLRTLTAFEAGDFVMDYVGQVCAVACALHLPSVLICLSRFLWDPKC